MLKKKIITIIGARPQIIKSSAISRAIDTKFSDLLEEIVVHTGQHYDENMSKVFFDELNISLPNYNLQVKSGSHAVQTAKMVEGLEEIYLKEKPNAVLIYGDTNSTISGALVAAKMHIPIIHVEAGLRSFDKSMPEEINRILCDHMSTLLFTPTNAGVENLKNEGFDLTIKDKATIDKPNVYHCGDVMYDNSLYFSKVSDERATVLEINDLKMNQFVLMTVHRDSNTDNPIRLESIFKAALELANEHQITFVLPLHPRTRDKLNTLSRNLYTEINESPLIKIIDPVGFMDIIALEKNARIIMTDSGGLQKESFFFKKPCVILRPQTEWIEIVQNGNAIIAGTEKRSIVEAFNGLLHKFDYSFPEFYGNGRAAEFICQKIIDDL